MEHYYDSRTDEGHQDTYRQVGLAPAPRGGVSRRVPGNGARGNR